MVFSKRFGVQSGQVGLVVLLISAVLMTLAIGAASQSVVGLKTARQESESSQVFNFAEQGIEEALSQVLSETPGSAALPSGYSGSYQVAEKTTFSGILQVGHSASIVLTGATGPTFTVSWTGCNGVIVTVLGTSVSRYAYRSTGCITTSGFTEVANTADVPFVAGVDTLARIKAVSADTTITVTGSLPVQSHLVTATATQGTSNETRSVQVNKGVPAVPGIFDYSLFAGSGSLAQN